MFRHKLGAQFLQRRGFALLLFFFTRIPTSGHFAQPSLSLEARLLACDRPMSAYRRSPLIIVESSVVQEIDALPFRRNLATEAFNVCVPDELVRCARRDCLNSALGQLRPHRSLRIS
jgi:hypothetical protein